MIIGAENGAATLALGGALRVPRAKLWPLSLVTAAKAQGKNCGGSLRQLTAARTVSVRPGRPSRRCFQRSSIRRAAKTRVRRRLWGALEQYLAAAPRTLGLSEALVLLVRGEARQRLALVFAGVQLLSVSLP